MIRLHRLQVQRFRSFSERTIEFGPGLTIIRGRNEAGKSTLHQALRTILFSRPTSRRQELRAHRSWHHQSMFSLTLDLESSGQQYRLLKDFEARRAELQALDTEDIWRDPDTIQQLIESRLGFGSEALYLSLCHIDHDELKRLGADRSAANALLTHLQERIVGAGSARSPDEVLRLVRQRLNELRRGLDRPANNPGPLRRLAEEAQTITRQLAEARSRWEQFQQAQRQLLADRAELEKANQRFTHLQQLLATNRHLHQLAEQRAQLAKAYEQGRLRLNRAQTAAAELQQAEQRLRSLRAAEGAHALVPKADDLAHLRELQARVTVLADSIAARQEAAAAAGRQPNFSGTLRPVGLALMAVGIVGGTVGSSWLYGLTVAGVLMMLLSFWTGRERPDATLQDLQAEHEQAGEALQRELRRWQAAGVDELELRAESLRAAQQDLQNAADRLRTVLGDETVEDLDRDLDRVHRQLRTLDEQLAAAEPYRLDPSTFAEFEAEQQTTAARISTLEQRLRTSELDAARSEIEPEEILHLEEQLAAIEQRRRRLADHAAALDILAEELAAAREDLLTGVSTIIADEAAPLLTALTLGRYSGIEVASDLSDINVQTSAADGTPPINWRDLSRGTQDQIYFALRLSLARIAYGPHLPPLLLDDPFLTFDDDRAAACVAMLQAAAAAGRQIILFTYSDRYRTHAASNTVDL